jgi:integrase
VSVLAEAWYGGLKDLSPITMQAYRDRLDRQILPGLGQLRVRELTVGVLDRHLRLIVDKHGTATAKMCRSVLSGLCTLAARHDALERNPVRALGPVNAKAKKAPRAMTVPELRQLRAALTYNEQAIARDLPDLVSFMMATGLRIGETTGLAWDAVDLEQGTVDVRTAAIRIKGQGLVIKTTKTDAKRSYSPSGASRCSGAGPQLPSSARTAARDSQCFQPPSAAGATRPTRRPTYARPSRTRASTG